MTGVNPSHEELMAHLKWLDERCDETERFKAETRGRTSLDWCYVGLNTAYVCARHMFLHTMAINREDVLP